MLSQIPQDLHLIVVTGSLFKPFKWPLVFIHRTQFAALMWQLCQSVFIYPLNLEFFLAGGFPSVKTTAGVVGTSFDGPGFLSKNDVRSHERRHVCVCVCVFPDTDAPVSPRDSPGSNPDLPQAAGCLCNAVSPK